MPASIFGNPAAVVQLNQALFGTAPGNAKYENQLAQANATSAVSFARQLGQTVATGNDALAASVLANLGINNATLQTALGQAFAAFPNDRGVVVLNLTNILTTLEGNSVYGAAAAQFNAQVATNFQYSSNPVNTADSAVNAGTVTLTANTDTVTGNIFEAGLVFTPGGDDRINALQDEDRLTGTGTNPTLNATLGNINDNGGASITPTLNGISTVNVAFTGNQGGANRLDLQDATGLTNAVNITRISDTTPTVQVDNLLAAVTNLSVSNSNSGTAIVGINFAAGALAGAADATTLTLNRVNVVGLSVEDTGGVVGAEIGVAGLADGYETINLVSNGSANTVGTLSAEDLRTLNISGAQNLTLGTTATTTSGNLVEATRYGGGLANVAGSLTAINASTLTGALDITINGEIVSGLDGTSGNPVNLTITGGAGSDIIRLAAGAGVQNGDRIVGGAGNNTLQLLGNNTVATDGPANGPTVTQVQTLDIRTGHDSEGAPGGITPDTVTVDARAIADLASVTIRNEGQNRFNAAGAPIVGVAQPFQSTAEGMEVRLTNVNAATANGLVLLHGTTGNSTMANNVVNLNSTLAGVTTAGITLRDAPNTNLNFSAIVRFDSDNMPLNNVNTIVNVNLRDEDTEANTIYLTEFARHTGTVTITGGGTGNVFNLDTAGVGNGGQYAYAQGTGNALTTQPVQVQVDQSNVADTQKIQATTISAGTYAGNIVVRVTDPAVAQSATGAQLITMGTGADNVIFDRVNNATAGLSISDTVAGGAGLDILTIDGDNAGGISISASELQNVTGFETIQFIGNQAGSANPALGNGRAQFNAYNLTLTNAAIDANAAAGTTVVNVVNDNGNAGVNTVIGNTIAANSGVTLDLRTLSGGRAINYNGQETDSNAVLTVNATTAAVTAAAPVAGSVGTTATADRFILQDANINATMVIDGGALRTGGARIGHIANADVIEVRNAAVVTIADLTNISNVGTLEFTNDTAITQTSVLQLDNATLDRLVNSTQAAVGTNAVTIGNSFEVLTITAFDSLVAGAFTQLNLDASQTSNAALRLNITAGGGNDTIIAGAGDDNIVGGAGADTIALATGGGDDVRYSIAGTANIAASVTLTAADTITGFVVAAGADQDTINVVAGSFVSGGNAPVTTAAGNGDQVGNAQFLSGTLAALNPDIANAAFNGRFVVEVTDAIAANFTTQAGIDAAVTALTGKFNAGVVAGANFLFAVYDNQATSNAAIFRFLDNGTAGIQAAELSLVGVVTNIAADAFTAAHFA